MIYIKSFKNYEEFKKLFSVVEHGNGAKSRKNKILLAWLKDRRFLKTWLYVQRLSLEKGVSKEIIFKYDYLSAKSMDDVKNAVMHIMRWFAPYVFDPQNESYECVKDSKLFDLNDWTLRHRTLYLDDRNGLCADGDTKSVRYINSERDDRVFKMKAGKFITSCLDSLPFTEILPEQVKRWIGEEFARDWQVYAESRIGVSTLTLHVGSDESDFKTIYDDKRYKGDFHSCMGGEDKNGIFLALSALMEYPVLKCAFFIGEEIGCIGSSAADIGFFLTCRFCVQIDRCGSSDMVTKISGPLCSDSFIKAADCESWGYRESDGMMTDVEALAEAGVSISCINLSCGYYNPHTDNEFTHKPDLEKCWAFVCHLIEDCTAVYPFEYTNGWQGTTRTFFFFTSKTVSYMRWNVSLQKNRIPHSETSTTTWDVCILMSVEKVSAYCSSLLRSKP